MNLVASVTKCARTFPHRRRRRNDDLPVLHWVGKTSGSHATTDRGCRVDAPEFSNELCPMFLVLMQLCVTERCHGAESHFERSRLAFFVGGPISLHQAVSSSTQHAACGENQRAILLCNPKNRCKNFPSNRRVLSFRGAACPGFTTSCLPA